MTTTHLSPKTVSRTGTLIGTNLLTSVYLFIKALLHISAITGVFVLVNAIPCYIVHAIIHPHEDASLYAGALFWFTTFITFWLFGVIIDRAIRHYTKQIKKGIRKNPTL